MHRSIKIDAYTATITRVCSCIAGIIALGGLFLAATSEPVWGTVLLVLGPSVIFAVWRRLERN